MSHYQSVVVLLSCLFLVCHGKRTEASFDRAATQHAISQAHYQQVGESLLGKFTPLPASMAWHRMEENVRMSDTNELGSSNSSQVFRPMLTQRRKALPLGEQSTWYRMDISSARSALQSLLGDPPMAMPFLRPGANWRHYPVGMNAAVLERQSAPPAPPRGPPSGGWGGDDNGDGRSFYVTLMTKVEAAYVLTDWIARAKVYKMTGTFGNVLLATRYAALLKTLERLEQTASSNSFLGPVERFATQQKERGKKSIIFALYEGSKEDVEEVPFKERAGKILTVASAWLYRDDKSLLVTEVAVNPAEVSDPRSRADEYMRFGLAQITKAVSGE